MAPLQVKDCPDDVYEALRAYAARENRSISQQTVTILQEYLGLRKPFQGAQRVTYDERSHVGALRRIGQMAPVALPREYGSAADILREVREECAR